MKVVHLIHSIAEQASGPSYSIRRLCESLIENKQEVVLATLDWDVMTETPGFLKEFPLTLGRRRPGLSSSMRLWLTKQAEMKKVDLFHSHSLWMMPNIYPGNIARKNNIPYIISPRGTFAEYAMASGSKIKHVFWPLIQRPAVNAANCFHATAMSEFEDIRRLRFSQPIAIIPNGIDMPQHKETTLGNTRTLLFLGRIHLEKGVDNLLRAWQVVSRGFPEWQLKIVGPDSGGYLSKMKALKEKLRLKRIEFVGALYGEKKIEAYRNAELFVLPSPSENFGISVAEALSVGIPVIVTKGTPWRNLESLGAGWWIDIGVDPLVACLEVALSKPRDILKAMGIRGREWIRIEFSWTEVTRKMIETYQWILRGGSKPDWIFE